MAETVQHSSFTQWRLIRESESNGGELFPITSETLTIGRELDNDLPLDDIHASKYHARVTQRGDQLIIEDLDSINGTSVNAGLLTGPYVLRHNDTITIGSFIFRVERTPGHIPQSRIDTSAYPVVQAEPPPKRDLRLGVLLAALTGGLVLIALLGVLLWIFLVSPETATVAEVPSPAKTVVLDGPHLVINQAPPGEGLVFVSEAVLIQVIASDAAGVARIELWANGRKVDELRNRLDRNVPSMTAAFRWSSNRPGTYALEVRAYNVAGVESAAPVARLQVIAEPETSTPQPSPTASRTSTPLPASPSPSATAALTDTPVPTPTATSTPSIVEAGINVPGLNVRSGPGRQYNPVDQLSQGERAEVLGQANIGDGQWWKIRYSSGTDLFEGWISANPQFSTLLSTAAVPVVDVPALPTATVTATPTNLPLSTPTALPVDVLRAPDGKTLLIISNRSQTNQPARLTLSGGKSVGGGLEIDPPAGGEVQVVLDPDHYRALWSSPARPGGFVRGADFTAVAGKVMVMWIVPEEGLTATEVYDQLVSGGALEPSSPPTATPVPIISGYVAPSDKALLVAANRSVANANALLTIAGGNFGGGREIVLDANTETPLELRPGSFRTLWSLPIRRGFVVGHEFSAVAGEVILMWTIPEDGTVFKQTPGQSPVLVNN